MRIIILKIVKEKERKTDTLKAKNIDNVSYVVLKTFQIQYRHFYFRTDNKVRQE